MRIEGVITIINGLILVDGIELSAEIKREFVSDERCDDPEYTGFWESCGVYQITIDKLIPHVDIATLQKLVNETG